MRWINAAEFPADTDLAQVDKKLHQEMVAHRITMESDVQVLWLADHDDVQSIVQKVRYWLENPDALTLDDASPRKSSTKPVRLSVQPSPVTLALVALSFVGAGLFYFGMEFVRPFTFWDAYQRFGPGENAFRDIVAGDYWRIITPIFLHFSPTHSIFNALWLWYLGAMVEKTSGASRLLTLVFLIGLVSNIAQALVSSDYAVFGGMSGVVFGLMSYLWLAQRLGGPPGYMLSNAIFFFMTGYMLLSTLGLFDWLAGGNVADTAHITGYITGMISAVAIHLTNQRNTENDT